MGASASVPARIEVGGVDPLLRDLKGESRHGLVATNRVGKPTLKQSLGAAVLAVTEAATMDSCDGTANREGLAKALCATAVVTPLLRNALNEVVTAALGVAGCGAAEDWTAWDEIPEGKRRTLVAYAPVARPVAAGDRVYAMRQWYFWPAVVTRTDGRRADLDFFHAEYFDGVTAVEGVDILEDVRHAEGAMEWVVRTDTDTRLDAAYFCEADRIVALLATGAVEGDDAAKADVKAWFEQRYNLGTAACGADYWTFFLARAAASHRLDRIGARLDAVYERDALAVRLGGRESTFPTGGTAASHLRTDDASPLFSGFAAWFRKRSSFAKIDGDGDALDRAYGHLGILVGLAVDKLFLARMRALYGDRVEGAKVKTLERALEKADAEYAAEARPRTARCADVVRCGVTAASPAELLADWDALAAALPVLRAKNTFRPDAADERAAAYGYGCVLVNVALIPEDCSLGRLCAAARKLWHSYTEHQPTWDQTLARAAKQYLCDIADQGEPVLAVCEVQLRYAPYVTEGRDKSHLHYKIVRAADPAALLHDFRADSPYVTDDLHQKFVQELMEYDYEPELPEV